MSTPENQSPSAPSNLPNNAGDAAACLQRQVNTLLLAMIVLSGTIAVLLFWQTRYLRRDLNAMKPTTAAILQAYGQEKPGVDAFIAKISEYARTHPDFMPLVQKYQLQIPTNAPAAAPAAKPTPSTTPAKK